MKSIYNYDDYKEYLRERLGRKGQRTGERQKAARFIGVQTAYLSQVLNGGAHLSEDQAYQLGQFLLLGADEREFLLLLVQKERAGTPALREFYLTKLKAQRSKKQEIASHVPATQEVPEKAMGKYYSSWYLLALHMALSIPSLQTVHSLSSHFHLPPQQILEALDFLVEHQLAVKNGPQYSIGPAHIHLQSTSEYILRHHSNWRIKALEAISVQKNENLHYSVVYSLAKNDAQRIRNEILKLIEANRKIVEPSEEEVLYCHCIDFFEV